MSGSKGRLYAEWGISFSATWFPMREKFLSYSACWGCESVHSQEGAIVYILCALYMFTIKSMLNRNRATTVWHLLCVNPWKLMYSIGQLKLSEKEGGGRGEEMSVPGTLSNTWWRHLLWCRIQVLLVTYAFDFPTFRLFDLKKSSLFFWLLAEKKQRLWSIFPLLGAGNGRPNI